MSVKEDQPSWLRPWPMLAGFLLTLLALAIAGHHLGERGFHGDFVRFHPAIAPDASYRPTMLEMRAVVRQNAAPDKVLVVVAGNSILLGVGQKRKDIWSKRLQTLLGKDFNVVNLSFRGISPTSGGALVAESLLDEFPRQIVISNLDVGRKLNPSPRGTYQFINFDAFHKGMLLPWEPRDAAFEKIPLNNEEALAARIDTVLHQNEFWNWWSTKVAFTFPQHLHPTVGTAFLPRSSFKDREPDYDNTPYLERMAVFEDRNLEIVANRGDSFFPELADGEWQLDGAKYAEFIKSASDAIPDRVKPHTLLVVGRDAPYYSDKVSADLRERDSLAVAKTIEGLESVGYETLSYGEDFAPEFYGDRTHLTKAGGARLAEIVAPKVKEMASKLNYLPLPE